MLDKLASVDDSFCLTEREKRFGGGLEITEMFSVSSFGLGATAISVLACSGFFRVVAPGYEDNENKYLHFFFVGEDF